MTDLRDWPTSFTGRAPPFPDAVAVEPWLEPDMVQTSEET